MQGAWHKDLLDPVSSCGASNRLYIERYAGGAIRRHRSFLYALAGTKGGENMKITKTAEEQNKDIVKGGILFGVIFILVSLWLFASHHSFFGEMFLGAGILLPLLMLSRYSTAAAKTSGVVLGIGIGGILVVLGIICFQIPVIGWILGILFILFGIVTPFGGLKLNATSFQRIQGDCPRCGNKLIAHKTDKALTCKICQRRVLVTEKGFELA